MFTESFIVWIWDVWKRFLWRLRSISQAFGRWWNSGGLRYQWLNPLIRSQLTVLFWGINQAVGLSWKKWVTAACPWEDFLSFSCHEVINLSHRPTTMKLCLHRDDWNLRDYLPSSLLYQTIRCVIQMLHCCCFWNRVLLCSPGCPVTHYADHNGPKLWDFLTSTSRLLGFEARTTTLSSDPNSNSLLVPNILKKRGLFMKVRRLTPPPQITIISSFLY